MVESGRILLFLCLFFTITLSGCSPSPRDIATSTFSALPLLLLISSLNILLSVRIWNKYSIHKEKYLLKIHFLEFLIAFILSNIILNIFADKWAHHPTISIWEIGNIYNIYFMDIFALFTLIPIIVIFSNLMVKFLAFRKKIKYHYIIPILLYLLLSIIYIRGLIFNKFGFLRPLLENIYQGRHLDFDLGVLPLIIFVILWGILFALDYKLFKKINF